jgi:hypothetical protein
LFGATGCAATAKLFLRHGCRFSSENDTLKRALEIVTIWIDLLSPALRLARLSFNRISARLRLSAALLVLINRSMLLEPDNVREELEKLLKKPDELFDDLIDRLNFHLNSEASIHHGNYKADLFRLCQEAYVNGYFEPSSEVRFTGQSLNTRLSERWTKGNEKRQQLLDSLFPMWNEWHYALEMCTKP